MTQSSLRRRCRVRCETIKLTIFTSLLHTLVGFFGMPNFVERMFMNWVIKPSVKKQTHAQGIGRHSKEEVLKIGLADLEACSAFGASPQEALAERERAKRAWLEAARAEGKPIPAPRYRAPHRRTA